MRLFGLFEVGISYSFIHKVGLTSTEVADSSSVTARSPELRAARRSLLDSTVPVRQTVEDGRHGTAL